MADKKNIALFMGILENEYSNSIMEGAILGARECDVNLIVFPVDIIDAIYSDDDRNAFRYQYNIFNSYINTNSFDGVIIEYGTITSYLSPEKKKDFLQLIGSTPAYLLAEKIDGYASICLDNKSGLVEILEHLILYHKYSKIAFLSGPKTNYDANLRLNTYREITQKYNCYLGESWEYYGTFSIYVEKEVNQILDDHPDVEAIVCANDGMAFGVAKILSERGLQAGKDIFVTGYDNLLAGAFHEPPLTTVNADPKELSRRAVHELSACNGNSLSNIELKTSMVKRTSCGCCDSTGDEVVRQFLGIPTDWREMARFQMEENAFHHGLEYELANITREFVFVGKTSKDRYMSTLSMMQRFHFKSCALFLYDHFIEHNYGDVWVNPEYVNLVGFYSYLNETDCYVFDIGERVIPTNELFRGGIFGDSNRHEVTVLPLFFGNQQIGFICVETDIKRVLSASYVAGQVSSMLYTVAMNEEQERMKRELEYANKSKDHFLANMSHEIRTPINAIIGFNEMIIRDSHDETIEEYANDAKNAADALLMLVNDILDFSKIEAGKMDIIESKYNLLDLINGVTGMIYTRAADKHLSLMSEYDESLPSVLEGDFGRLQQILINLLSNSVKYTENGTINFKVLGDVTDDFVNITFSVKDTGIGIKKDDISKLFNRFERIEEERNRSIEGTGLGINITCGLLKLMNSELIVDSEYGVGSEFKFTIKQKIISSVPIKNAKKKSSEHKDETSHFTSENVKLLIVDDNFLNRKVLISLLRETGIQIDQAASGEECINLAQNNTYDAILLDHMMPKMDGIETLEILLQNGYVDSTTPVVALTANAIKGAEKFYLEKGFSNYLSKPVLPKDLYELLISILPDDKLNRQ